LNKGLVERGVPVFELAPAVWENDQATAPAGGGQPEAPGF